jgi:hypothetical protein
VRSWAKGRSRPGHLYMERICDTFGVKPEVFFRRGL